jgi:hypothetical protein
MNVQKTVWSLRPAKCIARLLALEREKAALASQLEILESILQEMSSTLKTPHHDNPYKI